MCHSIAIPDHRKDLKWQKGKGSGIFGTGSCGTVLVLLPVLVACQATWMFMGGDS